MLTALLRIVISTKFEYFNGNILWIKWISEMKWAIILLIGTLIFAERGTTKQVQSILQLLQELKDKEYRYLELSVIIEFLF